MAGAVSRELQHLWLQLIRKKWSSLALIPTEPGSSAGAIAGALIQMAPFYDLGEVKLIDAQGASLQDGVRLATELSSSATAGSRVVVSVDSPMQNGGAMPLVMAVDASVLLVRVGASDLQSIRDIIAIVGHERVAGAVTV